ncbi:MAG: OmpA family protein [Gammaproteobacteria bacterium]|nr:OmpA family protein [Gammaproteobacteria bacterium]HXK55299.1 OmpA family protein [Gammaproteobacteria bacterium]
MSNNNNSRSLWIWSIFATLAAIVGIGAYFMERSEFLAYQRVAGARQSQLSEEISGLKHSIQILHGENSRLSDTGKSLRVKLGSAETDIRKLDQTLKGTIAARDMLDSNLKASESSRIQLQQEFERLSKTSENIKNELTSSMNARNQLNQRLAEIQTSREQISKELAAWIDTRDRLTEDLDQLQQSKQKINDELTHSLSDKQQLNTSLGELQTSTDRISEQLEQSARAREGLKKRLDLLQSSKEQISSKLESSLANEQKLTADLAKNRALRDKISDELKQALTTGERLSADLERTRSEKERISSELEASMVERDRLHADLETIKESRAREQQELAALAATQNELNRDLLASQAIQEQLKKEVEQKTKSQLKLERQQQAAAQERANLITRLEQSNARQKLLQSRIDTASAAIAFKEQEISSTQQTIAALRANYQRVSSDYEDLARRFSELEMLRSREREQFTELQRELQKRQVQIQHLQDRSTVIQVPAEVLFNISSFNIKRSGKETLKLVAELLNAYPDRLISVEGHSDAVPVGRESPFPSNWELSSARAAAAVRFLQHNANVDPRRMVVTGYGSQRPIASNDTAEGRRANRRVEIMLVSERGERRVLNQ